MMKKSLFLVLFLVSSFIFSQNNIDSEKERLQIQKSKIQSETIMGFVPDENGKASDIGTKKTTRIFDSKGNVVSYIEYNSKSAPVLRKEFSYNVMNQVVISKEYEGYDKLKEQLKYEYEKNRLVKKIEKTDSSIFNIFYQYDNYGNLIAKIKKDENKIQKNIFEYSYNGKNQVSEKYKSDKIQVEKTFEYDVKGQLINEKSKINGFENVTMRYEYDSLGNRVKETEFAIGNVINESFEYIFDASKRVTNVKKYNFDEHLLYTWRYFYDSKGNVEFVKIYEGKDSRLVYITQYVYRYY